MRHTKTPKSPHHKAKKHHKRRIHTTTPSAPTSPLLHHHHKRNLSTIDSNDINATTTTTTISSAITPDIIKHLNEKELAALENNINEIDEILPHNPEEGIPCNFIELPPTAKHLKTVKPWSVMSFTDNIPKSMTFEQMQQQVTFYLENGGRVLKLFPGYEPYMFESIATQCRLHNINPNDLTMILPISAYEVKTGMHPKSHPVPPRFFSKEDKIKYIRENCPQFVPHRRGFFVHKIVQQLTTKIDGLNLDKTLNLPIEQLYEDYPENYDPRRGGYIDILNDKFRDKNIEFTNNAETNTTTITLHDMTKVDPLDHFASQELPDGHVLKPQNYENGATQINLPSGRYPADRLRDKVYQVTSHLASENVDLVVLNELEHIHEEFMGNVYDTLLESFFQCELLVLDGKTRGYGVQSRLISTHYNHDHYVSPYKLLLISNYCAELARLYKGLPTKDPYFHPQQIRMLMDICSGAVLPPQGVVDDMYGDFKQHFMADLKALQTGESSSNSSTNNNNNNNNSPNNFGSDDLISSLKSGLGLNDTDKNKNAQNVTKKGMSLNMSDYFNNNGLKPIQIDSITHATNALNNGEDIETIDLSMKTKDGKKTKQGSLSFSADFLFGQKKGHLLNTSASPDDLTNTTQHADINNEQFDDINSLNGSDPLQKQNNNNNNNNNNQKKKQNLSHLTTTQALLKKQFETVDEQIAIVMESKRLALLADGSTADDRQKLQQRQQVLLDNNMILPSENAVVSDENFAKLYAPDSKYLLTDSGDGERGKYKDLRLARRLLESKGESADPNLLLKSDNKAQQQLLLAPGGVVTPEELLKEELFNTNSVTIQSNTVNQEETNEQQQQQQDDDNNNTADNNNTNNAKKTTKKKKNQKVVDTTPTSNEELHFQQRIAAAAAQEEQKNNNNNINNASQNTTSNDKTSQDYYESAINSMSTQLTTTTTSNSSIAIQNALKTNFGNYKYYNPHAIISQDKLRSEVLSFQLMESLQKLLPNEDSKALVKTATAYYEKVQKEIALNAARQIAVKKIDHFLVKGLALQQIFVNETILLKAQNKMRKTGGNMEKFEEDVLKKFKKTSNNNNNNNNPITLAQVQHSLDNVLTPLQRLQLLTTPKMIANWEQWKKGERKRQFNGEVAMALEREYANIFQNIIYKTLSYNTAQDIFTPQSSADGADGEEKDNSTTQNNNELKMPKLKLGQLFSTKTFQHLYTLMNDKAGGLDKTDNNNNNKNKKKFRSDETEDEKLKKEKRQNDLNDDNTLSDATTEPTTDEIEKITAAYATLTAEQQDELQRIATYIPLYTTTGILPLFPAHVLEKHHALRHDLIKKEIERQEAIQNKYENEQQQQQQQQQGEDQEEEQQQKESTTTTEENGDEEKNNNQDNQNKKKKKKKQSLFDPNYELLMKNQLLLTQDRTWYDDAYVPLWLCNKRQSRLLLLEPEVNIGNYNFTTQKSHPIPVTKAQWKVYKQQQQTESPIEMSTTSLDDNNNNNNEENNGNNDKLKKLVKGSLYHVDTSNLTLITPHQYTIQHGMLLSTQNTFDVTVDDKTIRLLDSPTVNKGIQQQLSDYLTHALSFLRTLERSYPYQARDSLAKNLPPALAVSTAQMLQMELPHISTVPEVENVLYNRLLPQIQGAVNVLEQHEEFREFASQLAVAGEKTKNAAESCIFSYNTPIVNQAQRQIQSLHKSLDVIEAISIQLLWISLGLGFDSVGLPQATLAATPTIYLQHIFMRDHGATSNVGDALRNQLITTHQQNGLPMNSRLLEKKVNYVNNRDVSQLKTLSREEALQVLHTATIQVIPVLKKKLQELKQHLSSTPYSRQQDVAIATSERHYLAQSNVRQFHMISSDTHGDGTPVDQEELQKKPQYRRYQQELEISKELEEMFKINPFVPAELAFDEKYKIESRAQNHLLLLQYDNIHGLDYSKAAQH